MSVGDTADPDQALIITASNVDEPITPLASELVDDQAVDAFVTDMDPHLAGDIRSTVKQVRVQMRGDSTVYGSVVAVGCVEPVAVSWKITPDGIETTADVPKSNVQCLVPVTSVAIFYIVYR